LEKNWGKIPPVNGHPEIMISNPENFRMGYIVYCDMKKISGKNLIIKGECIIFVLLN
jgi:hypothetical protein